MIQSAREAKETVERLETLHPSLKNPMLTSLGVTSLDMAEHSNAKNYLAGMRDPSVLSLVKSSELMLGFKGLLLQMPEHLRPYPILKMMEDSLATYRQALEGDYK